MLGGSEEAEMTEIRLDGSRIGDMPSFLKEIAAAFNVEYFGWDLHSLQDCLHGGYGAKPPYRIVVEKAEPMIQAFGLQGCERYCEDMLRVIDEGGRGLVEEDSREWYESQRRSAAKSEGETLLDLLFDVFRDAPANITLVSADGKCLGSSGDVASVKRCPLSATENM